MASNSSLPGQEKKQDSYYESGMRWIENTYLSWFGENRTSYGVKDSLSQTKVTGNKDVDGAQDGVNDAVGNTFGKDGIAGSVGNAADKTFLSR
ncbi:hypothetical protein LSUE1_G000632 [Lachnellula suecica]|uniref:Uncharacterized protein n=1 Tax=Lachnellula suecica TaxID=602035 RepID=A0A8T9CH04_9HELO|nr:hypothetical protein LSUE1_G000632 [Lachnellula suecica]